MTENLSKSNLINMPQKFKSPNAQGAVESGIIVEGQTLPSDKVIPIEVSDSWTPNPEAIARVSRVSAEEVGRRILEIRSLSHDE